MWRTLGSESFCGKISNESQKLCSWLILKMKAIFTYPQILVTLSLISFCLSWWWFTMWSITKLENINTWHDFLGAQAYLYIQNYFQTQCTDWTNKLQKEERTWFPKWLDYRMHLTFWPLQVGILLGIKRPQNFRVEMNLGHHESSLLSCIGKPSTGRFTSTPIFINSVTGKSFAREAASFL